MAPIDLNLLPLFGIVAETASFSEAARKLGVPRSSVSRGVAQLEAAVGVQLFNRTTRKVALSTAGAAFYERVAPQLAALEQSIGSLPERDQMPSGELRLTAAPDFGVTVLPEILAGFSQRYPAVNIDVRLTGKLVDLVADGFDAALRISGPRLADSSLVARRLAKLEIGLYAAPAYLARRGEIRTAADTAAHDWVSFRAGLPQSPFPKPARRARFGGDEMLFVYGAVLAGAGIGLLPSFLTTNDVAAGRLTRLLPRYTSPNGVLYFVHPAGAKPPRKVTAFRDYVVEFIAAHPLCPGITGQRA
jgi:DNA-binding transcriptional LysR family regulator